MTIHAAIAWFALWRRFVFRPDEGTVFERDCLSHISQFLQELDTEYKLKGNKDAT